jgi:hypothetical protein
MSDIHLIEALALTNIFQLFFWGYHVHVLVNKAMSKNFAEYKLVKDGPTQVVETPIEEDYDEEDILGELNGILPGRAIS